MKKTFSQYPGVNKQTCSFRINQIKDIFLNTGMIIILTVLLLPFFWLVMTSLKSLRDAFAYPPVWLFKPTLSNYIALINQGFLKYYMNSIIVAISSTILSLAVGVPAAYALERMRLKRNEDVFFFILSQRMAPPIMVVIPFFLIVLALGMLDTYPPLMIIYLLFNVPFVVLIMRGFFREVPREVEEAAMMDGCGIFKSFFKVSLPLVSSGLFATALFCIIQSWNEFLFALILTKDAAKTAPVTITAFIGYEGTQWGLISASGTLIVIPVVLLALFSQKSLIRGFTLGAVKG